jgi:endonuclease-3 related protein
MTPREVYRALLRHYGPQGWWPGRTPFEVAVGAILTQNTAWTNVEKAIARLRREGLLTPRAMSAAPHARLAAAIRPAGYFNVKALRLRRFLTFLNGRYSGSLRRLFRLPARRLRVELLGVNGIGPETADSIILYAAGKRAFVVDAYTRRLFSRLGSLPDDADYQATQAYLTARLPRRTSLYNEFHALVVAHAKRFCRTRPRCPECPLRGACAHAGGPGEPPSFNIAVTSP